ncbi:MAG: peptide chain release factor N(5)-glutamine methyltransferase [Rhodobacterales bacterium]|nr:peptide chain release factor N(5)-glutamine methyltransferase [Rhodobacterales bacterium]
MGESLRLVDVLTRTGAWLRTRGIESPRLEAELLLCHVLKMERLQLYLAHDRPMTDVELKALRPLVARRGGREPMAWILGTQGFHAIDLDIVPGVLVPRPDTETLVDAALAWIDADADPVYVADVGCGSGAVGLAVATAHPGVRVFATDISKRALTCTRANVVALDLGKRVAVLEGDLLSPIPSNRPVDWVLSNPPYIPSRTIDTLQPEVSKHEPRLALDGGRDGLACYKRLIPLAAKLVRQGVIVEVGHDQAAAVVDLFKRAGLTDIRTWDDLGGIARVVGGRTG